MDVLKRMSWKTLVLANAAAFFFVIGAQDVAAGHEGFCEEHSQGCACINDVAFIPDGCHETNTGGSTCRTAGDCAT
jgi:hypothetical protein